MEVRGDDVQRWAPARVVAKAGLHDFRFDIIVAKRLSIRGRVVDERGRSVAGMVVVDSDGGGRPRVHAERRHFRVVRRGGRQADGAAACVALEIHAG